MEDWQADGSLAHCSLGSARQNLKDENMPQFIAGCLYASNIKHWNMKHTAETSIVLYTDKFPMSV